MFFKKKKIPWDQIPRRRIEREDDVVIVYYEGETVYKGWVFEEPTRDEDWRYDKSNVCYRWRCYIKICLDN